MIFYHEYQMNVTTTELETHFEKDEKVTALYAVIEDKYWGDLAVQAKKEGSFQGDAMAELLKMAEEKGVILELPLP
jgi:hypothetical protein